MLIFTVLKTALTKKNLFFLIPLSICLVGAFIYYFSFVRIKPNDLIVTTSDGVALFSNENPEFKVDFGSKENPQGQIIRFEAQASNENPFEVEGKKSIFTIIAELFKPKSKVGIEMSLVGIDFSETEKTQNATLASNIQTVAEILGTDQVETSTNLIDMGREVGSLDTEESVSKPTIVNSNVANGIDLEYQILAGYGLKEEIVINDLEAYAESCGEGCSLPLNKFEFNLSVDDGVVLKKGWFTVEGQSTEIYYFVDGDGKYLAHFLPSYAVDKVGEKTYEVDLDIQEYSVGKFKAVVTVDSEWLLSGDRVYPIRIDPSIVHDDSTDFASGIQLWTKYFSNSGLKIADPSLIGTWNMNETTNGTCSGGGDICDQSGNNFNATISGTATSVVSPESYGRDFDGVTGTYASLGDLVAFEVQSFTIDAYVKKEGTCGTYNYCTIMSKGGSGNKGFGFAIYGGKLHLRLNDLGTGSTQYLTGTTTLSDNVWYYVAVSVDGANKTINLFINGNLEATGKFTDTISYSTENVKFGNSNNGNDLSMNGVIDGIRFWNVAKDANYIKSAYSKSGSSVFGLYTSSSANLGSTISGVTMSWLEAGVNTGGGETPYSSTGLIAQWNFNETSGTTAVSGGTCGTSCNGTLTNMTTTGQDVATMTGWTSNNRRWGAGAVMFDGSNDYVVVSNNSALNPTSAVTVESWIYMTSLPASGGLYEVAGKSSSTAGHALYDLAIYNNSGVLQAYWRMHLSSSLTTYSYQVNYAFQSGTWYHIVGTYDKTTAKMVLYINGTKIGADMTTLGEDMYSGNNQNLFIGVFDYNGTKSRYFNGVIDSTRIYSRALSANEILSNYQVGNIEFQYRVSTNGSTWSNWTAYNDGALMFDGMDDYVNLGDVNSFDSLTELSTCAWVKHNSLTDDDHILSKVDSSTWSGFMFFRDDVGQETGRTDMYKVWVSKDTNAKWIESATNSSVSGAWTHVCMTFKANDATGLRLYINGVEDANSPVSTVGLTTIDSGTTNLVIGRYDPTSANYINGSMDDLQVYNRVLSSSEIVSNYATSNVGTPYDSSNLYAHWNFDESNGTTAINSGEGSGLNGTLTNFSSTSGRDSLSTSGWSSKSKRGSDTSWYSYDNQYLYSTAETGLVGYWPLEESSGSGAYLKNAVSSTPFATGGIVTYSGDYVIHTFLSSGVFTVNGGGNVDVLLVGGGGGGNIGRTNTYLGAGGGGGQVRILSSQSVTSGNINVTIGQGGAGLASTQIDINGNTGGATSFGALSASGGTGGYYANGYGGTNGDGTHTGGAPSGIYAGGGGGAGANGQAGNSSTPKGGNGGAGIACDYSGSSVYYGGGGGAAGASGTRGEGGTGGGGAGSTTSSNSVAGTANTGGGGGAGGYTDHASSGGGSGIVIVRYPVYYIGAGSIQPVFSSVSGGTVTSSGGYTLHTFTSSGTLTVNGNGNVEVLVVGGGGGGGSGLGGGGGAGGVVYNASFNISTNAYTVTVGNGGGSNTSCNPGSSGGNSVFSTITAYGGGGGGGYSGYPVSGGSGGGSAGDGSYTGNGASGTANQGNSGGWGAGPSTYVAGGGGGAGAAGGNGSGTTSGSGGSGVAYAISGTSTYYGGGGGGAGTSVDNSRAAGSGGTGGGGAGNAASGGAGYSGTANTGGGGGGGAGGACNSGGSGGSGIVIVRYPSSYVSGSSSDGTPTGTTFVNGKYGGARNFSSSSDILSISPISLSGIDYTIETWFQYPLASSSDWNTLTRGDSDHQVIIQRSTMLLGMYDNTGGTGFNSSGFVMSTLSNGWHHLAAVGTGTTTSFYIDGSYVGSSAKKSSATIAYIGNYQGGSQQFGTIDEFRIFNLARTAAQIKSDYIQGISSNGSVYQQETGGGVIKLEGTNSNRITNSLNDGLVSYWKLDESSGTSLSDSVGSNTGTATGTSVVTGKYSNARSFNGSSDLIGAAVSGLPIGSTSRTISAWFNTASTPKTHNTIFAYGSAAAGKVIYLITLRSDGRAYFESGSGGDPLYSSGALNNGQWHQVVLSYDSTTVRLYIDGLLNSSVSTTLATVSSAFQIGNMPWDANYKFTGVIDEVKIYNIAKTAAEILEEYNATSTYYTNYNIASTDLSNKNTLPISFAGDKVGSYASVTWGESAYANYQTDANTIALWHLDEISGSGAYLKDSSGKNNNGTPTGTTYISSGKVTGARSFNGSSDYINVGSGISLANSSFTIDTWAKLNATGVSSYIIGQGATTGTDYTLQFGFRNTNVFTCSFFGDDLDTPTAYADTNWHHWACTYDSSTKSRSIYRDGILVVRGTASGNYLGSGTLVIGAGWYNGALWSGNYFNGYIDETRIGKVVRTPDEIRQAYEVGLRTHNITVDFGATLNSGNLISSSSDTSFTIDATTQGLSQMGSNLYVGDKIIVREVSSGTEYLAQGTVSAITASTGVTTVTSWDTNSTFPSGGFTTKATVFKWQTEYISVKNRTIGTQVDATSLLTLRFVGAFGGRNIWIDDLRNSTGYISNSAGDSVTFPYEAGYLQYKAIITSQDSLVTPYLSQVQFDYSSGGPTMDQIMRHGKWFDSGTKKNFWWSGGQ